VVRPAGPNGFGTQLASRSMSGHLGGSIEYNWDEAGVIVTLRMTKANLAR
jgi:two-component sensor histidine kinase